MDISLTSELEQFVRNKVSSGGFQDASAVVMAALCGMKERDGERDHQTAWLRAAIEQGWNEAQAGQLVSSDAAKSNMARFKDEYKKSRTACV